MAEFSDGEAAACVFDEQAVGGEVTEPVLEGFAAELASAGLAVEELGGRHLSLFASSRTISHVQARIGPLPIAGQSASWWTARSHTSPAPIGRRSGRALDGDDRVGAARDLQLQLRH